VSRYDVAVIGAGIHGASAAFHLATRGVRVVVFDMAVPAAGPTGRSSAVCRAYYTNPFLAGVARDSLTMFANFGELTDGGDAGYRRTGSFFLHPVSDTAAVDQTAAQLVSLGVQVDVLSGAALGDALTGFVLDDIATGVWEPNSGYADPAGTTVGLMSKAVSLGARLRTDARVVMIGAGPGPISVTIGDGTVVEVDRLLVAAGPWTRPLLGRIGVDLPLTVERHVVASYAWGTSSRVPFVFADLTGRFYAKPDGVEQFQVGPLGAAPKVDPDNFDQSISLDESVELAAAVVRRFPAAAEAEDRHGWASLYDVSPDWQPVIGEVADRVFVDAGTSGHGFKLGPAIGGHVADLVCGGAVDPGLAQFDPFRFSRGEELVGGFGALRILG